MPTRTRIAQTIVATGLTAVLVLASAASSQARPPKLPWLGPGIRAKPHSLVVTFASDTTVAERRSIHGRVGARPLSLDRDQRVDVVRLPEHVRPFEAIRWYQALPGVLTAELDRFVELDAISDDELVRWQWALHNGHQAHPITGAPNTLVQGMSGADVDAPLAWANATPGDDIVVAVIDSGVDIDHPDLVNRIWVNAVEQAGVPEFDDDGNGYVDDVNGWDFRGDDVDPSPGTTFVGSHGTHVAGIVAAERDNGIGVAGVCASCRIMPLRFDLSLGQELMAIEYAVANGADIINMSYGTPVWSPAQRGAIEAAGEAGVLTVASAGNSSLDNDIGTYVGDSYAPNFPSSYNLPTILAVAATNHRDRYALSTKCDLSTTPTWRCAFTSWGHDSVDVAAPGADIISTFATGGNIAPGYQVLDGTSMASPLVAGIAGMVKHEHPEYGPLDLKNAVMNGVDDHSGMDLFLLTAWADLTGLSKTPMDGDFTRTQGRVDAYGGIIGSTGNATPLTDGNVDGARSVAQSVRQRVMWPHDVNDVYRRRLVAGNRYRIALNGPAGEDFDLYVWSPNVQEIHQFTSGCFRRNGPCPALRAVSGSLDADEQVTFSVNKTGVFYIQVQGWYSGGNYTLTVRRV